MSETKQLRHAAWSAVLALEHAAAISGRDDSGHFTAQADALRDALRQQATSTPEPASEPDFGRDSDGEPTLRVCPNCGKLTSQSHRLHTDGLPGQEEFFCKRPETAPLKVSDAVQRRISSEPNVVVGAVGGAVQPAPVAAMTGRKGWSDERMVDAAFTGFKALPETTSGTPWWEVLEVGSGAPVEEIRAQYRALAMQRHPDKEGGSDEAFRALQVALGQGLAARGVAR